MSATLADLLRGSLPIRRARLEMLSAFRGIRSAPDLAAFWKIVLEIGQRYESALAVPDSEHAADLMLGDHRDLTGGRPVRLFATEPDVRAPELEVIERNSRLGTAFSHYGLVLFQTLDPAGLCLGVRGPGAETTSLAERGQPNNAGTRPVARLTGPDDSLWTWFAGRACREFAMSWRRGAEITDGSLNNADRDKPLPVLFAGAAKHPLSYGDALDELSRDRDGGPTELGERLARFFLFAAADRWSRDELEQWPDPGEPSNPPWHVVILSRNSARQQEVATALDWAWPHLAPRERYDIQPWSELGEMSTDGRIILLLDAETLRQTPSWIDAFDRVVRREERELDRMVDPFLFGSHQKAFEELWDATQVPESSVAPRKVFHRQFIVGGGGPTAYHQSFRRMARTIWRDVRDDQADAVAALAAAQTDHGMAEKLQRLADGLLRVRTETDSVRLSLLGKLQDLFAEAPTSRAEAAMGRGGRRRVTGVVRSVEGSQMGSAAPADFWRERTVTELAAEQGIATPQRLDDLVGAAAHLWEDDEDLESFVSDVYARRREDREREERER